MFRNLSLLLVLLGCFVGCQQFPILEKLPDSREVSESDKRHSMNVLREIEESLMTKPQTNAIGVDFDFNVNDPVMNDTVKSKPTTGTPRSSFDMSDQDMEDLAAEKRKWLREEIAGAPRGSQVGLHDESGGRYCGTVLHAGSDRLELMNCLSQETIPGPDGQLQCKTSHIPFLTIETSAVTHFVSVSPPPPDFPATDDEFDGTEYSVAEIVNRSGQRQRWGKPPVMDESVTQTALEHSTIR
jgi:hypothetical protein